ncbi:MAG: TIR domain-containing protein [Opitutaceae bacterium]|nr:TIR domain-containing protein [Opitutaceae bacterium]
MSVAGKAVFLSYAREDIAAARRIAEALRAAGVEVWFDESELRGGDAWDAKIRKQIDACTLFVPIISQHTDARAKGYFRLEWKLAVDQTHLLAEGVPFIAPVVIDDTRETGAVVPPEFLRVQWMRLPGALPTPEFVAQVQRLLTAPRHATAAAAKAASVQATSPVRTKFPSLVKSGVALAIVVVGLAAYFFRPAAKDSEPKSIAVLPFVNMSGDKENEYLSDGITEEILNSLAKVPGLRVPARTSSFVFKDRKEDVKKIGELLHVKTVLEGSVRKTGNQLRITAQLINVADGYHLWSETYDRDMTNIFVIQDDIARAIVTKLKITLTGEATQRSAKRHTDNIEAYKEVLKGRFHAEKYTESELKLAISHYQKALSMHPGYAEAYAGLASAYSLVRYFAYVAPDSITPQFREAVAKALQLDDMLADAHMSQAALHVYVDRDYSAAEREYKRALALDPVNASAHMYYALFLGAMSRHSESRVIAAKARQLDPLSVNAGVILAWVQFFAHDFDAAIQTGRQTLAMAPNYFNAHEVVAQSLFRKGLPAEAITQLEEACRFESPPQTLGQLGSLYGRAGRRAEAQKVLQQLLSKARQNYVPAYTISRVYDALNDNEQANVWMNKAIADHEGRVLFLKAGADDIMIANPYYPEWLKKLGFEK